MGQYRRLAMSPYGPVLGGPVLGGPILGRSIPRGTMLTLVLAGAGCLSIACASTLAWSQNNTAPFATGTDCSDLSGPRRSACRDAFDPRTNPSEWQRREHPGAILPRKPSGLGRAPASLAPKAPHQPILDPTPLLPRFKPLR